MNDVVKGKFFFNRPATLLNQQIVLLRYRLKISMSHTVSVLLSTPGEVVTKKVNGSAMILKRQPMCLVNLIGS